MTRLLLASASPARLSTLRAAGVHPAVQVSGVDEDAVLAAAGPLSPGDAVLTLARAKAEDVAATAPETDLVLGCDSMLELDGEIYGKPGTPEVAIARWRSMRGREAVLHTGHWLVDLRSGVPGRAVGRTSATGVRFADLSDAEIDAYVATGEPLRVAGAFTVDGLGGPYVESITGDYHGVVGVSLPLLRTLLGEVDVAFHELWATGPVAPAVVH